MRLLFYARPSPHPVRRPEAHTAERHTKTPGTTAPAPAAMESPPFEPVRRSGGRGASFRGRAISFRGQAYTIRTGRADPAHRIPGKIICIHAVGLGCIRLLDAIYLCCKS